MSNSALSPNVLELAEAVAAAVIRRINAIQPVAAAGSSPLLTVRETCSYLNCARSTLNRLEAGGRLVPKRFGRKVLYDRADLDAFIRNAEQGEAKLTTTRSQAPP